MDGLLISLNPLFVSIENLEVTPVDSSAIPKTESSSARAPTFPTTPPKIFNTTEYEYDKFMCTCDLTKNSCDINCCCDEECSIDDKKAFQGIHISICNEGYIKEVANNLPYKN